MSTRITSIILFCLYIATVAYLCFAKPEDLPQLPQIWFGLPADKIVHFCMFLPFPLLGYLAFRPRKISWGRAIMLMSILIAAGVSAAIGTEHMQAMLQYRTAASDDLLADMIGIFCGGAATVLYITMKKQA